MEHCLDGSTLEEEGIQHGENLIIMEGRLPPKGFLNFTIWLFPTIEKIPMPPVPTMNGIHSDVESKFINVMFFIEEVFFFFLHIVFNLNLFKF